MPEAAELARQLDGSIKQTAIQVVLDEALAKIVQRALREWRFLVAQTIQQHRQRGHSPPARRHLRPRRETRLEGS
jgi:hypothetical protein